MFVRVCACVRVHIYYTVFIEDTVLEDFDGRYLALITTKFSHLYVEYFLA